MKVAIVGTAPSSVSLAPYDDPEWTIWACSPGNMSVARRVDARFEIHPLAGPGVPESRDGWIHDRKYVKYLAAQECPVYMIEHLPEIPNSVAYPMKEMVEEFGRYFFTSTIAWMLALAIHQKAETIGLWGIDMATDDEYALQKAGCHYFIQEAVKRGIEVVIPPESDLHRPPILYGFDYASPMHVKLDARRNELLQRLQQAEQQMQASQLEAVFLKGALSDLAYVQNTWTQ